MSDSSVEQFTLQYQVSLGDSIGRLEALHEKMDKVNENKKGVGKLQKAINELRGGLSEVSPAADAAVGGIMRMGKGLPVLIAITAAVVGVVNAMRSLNAEYEKQRITGFQTGMSAFGVEQMQRQLVAGSGRIGPQQARDLMSKLAGTAMSAYVDPMQMNRDAIALRQIGINPMDKNGQLQSTTDMADQLSAKFKAVSMEQARAMGVTIGLTNDEVQALRNKEIAQREQSDAETAAISRSFQANQAMEQLNSATGQLSETGRRLSNSIGELLLPAFTGIVEWINGATKEIPNDINNAVLEFQIGWNRILTMIKNPTAALGLNGGDEQRKLMEESDRRVREENKKNALAADKQAAAAEQSRKAQGVMERSIALFAASVNTFTGTLSDQQAWAAWAGEFGKGEGYRGIGEMAPAGTQPSPGTLNNAGAGSPYVLASNSATASTAFNFGNIRGADGQFLRFESKESGMDAMARQLIRYQTKYGLDTTKGIISRWAPSNENDTSAYIKYMTQKMGLGADEKINFADPATLARFMHAMAGMEKGWNKLGGVNAGDFRASASRVIGGHTGMRAESRASMQAEPIAQQMAAYLGMSVDQFKRGQGVTTGDYDYYQNRLLFETQQAYTAASEKYRVAQSGGAPNAQMAAKAKQEMMQAETNFNTLRNFGNQWRGRAEVGERERSKGLPEITVNIYGMRDAADIEQAGHKAGSAVGNASVAALANSRTSVVDR